MTLAIIDRLNDDEMYVDAVDDAINIIQAQALLIQKYVKHKNGCMSLEKTRDSNGRFSSYACDCGLTKAQREIKKLAVNA